MVAAQARDLHLQLDELPCHGRSASRMVGLATGAIP